MDQNLYKARRSSARFHILLATATSLTVLCGLIGAPLAGVHIALREVSGPLVAVLVVFGAMLPLPAYWHQKGNFERRDAVLVIYWTVLFKVTLAYAIVLAARSQLPQQDALMRSVDQWCDVSVPALMGWAHSSWWLEALSNHIYFSLTPMLVLALLLPPLAGRRLAAQRFLLANVVGFAVGLSLFALLPVRGPWWGWHYTATALQLSDMNSLETIRNSSVFVLTSKTNLGMISFPSFHVFWAITSAWVLGQFRWLKWPAAVLAALICVSTMTTGYHYFADVLGGALLATVALVVAHVVLKPDLPGEAMAEALPTDAGTVTPVEVESSVQVGKMAQPSGVDR